MLNAIPQAISAICLNSIGLEKVKEAKPFSKFFSIFYSSEHLRSLIDDDMSTYLGQAMDELIRHHPALKMDIMKSVIAAMEKVIAIDNEENDASVGDQAERAKAAYRLFLGNPDAGDVIMVDEETKSDENRDVLGVQYIEVIARVSTSFSSI